MSYFKDENTNPLDYYGLRQPAIKQELMPSYKDITKPTRDVSAHHRSHSLSKETAFGLTSTSNKGSLQRRISELETQLEQCSYERQANIVYNKQFREIGRLLGDEQMEFEEIRSKIQDYVLQHPSLYSKNNLNNMVGQNQNTEQIRQFQEEISRLKTTLQRQINQKQNLSVRILKYQRVEQELRFQNKTLSQKIQSLNDEIHQFSQKLSQRSSEQVITSKRTISQLYTYKGVQLSASNLINELTERDKVIGEKNTKIQQIMDQLYKEQKKYQNLLTEKKNQLNSSEASFENKYQELQQKYERFSTQYENLDKKLLDYEHKIKQNQLSLSNYNQIQTNYKNLENSYHDIESKLTQQKSQATNYANLYETIKTELQQYRSRFQNVENDKTQIENQLTETKEKLSAQHNEVIKLGSYIDGLNNEINELQKNQKLLNAQIQTLGQGAESLTRANDQILQLKDLTEKLERDIRDMSSKNQQLNYDLDDAQRQIRSKTDEIIRIQTRHTELLNTYEEVRQKYTRSSQQYSQNLKRISQSNLSQHDRASQTKLKQYEQNLTELKEELKSQKSVKYQLTEQISSLKTKIQELNNQIEHQTKTMAAQNSNLSGGNRSMQRIQNVNSNIMESQVSSSHRTGQFRALTNNVDRTESYRYEINNTKNQQQNTINNEQHAEHRNLSMRSAHSVVIGSSSNQHSQSRIAQDQKKIHYENLLHQKDLALQRKDMLLHEKDERINELLRKIAQLQAALQALKAQRAQATSNNHLVAVHSQSNLQSQSRINSQSNVHSQSHVHSQSNRQSQSNSNSQSNMQSHSQINQQQASAAQISNNSSKHSISKNHQNMEYQNEAGSVMAARSIDHTNSNTQQLQQFQQSSSTQHQQQYQRISSTSQQQHHQQHVITNTSTMRMSSSGYQNHLQMTQQQQRKQSSQLQPRTSSKQQMSSSSSGSNAFSKLVMMGEDSISQKINRQSVKEQTTQRQQVSRQSISRQSLRQQVSRQQLSQQSSISNRNHQQTSQQSISKQQQQNQSRQSIQSRKQQEFGSKQSISQQSNLYKQCHQQQVQYKQPAQIDSKRSIHQRIKDVDQSRSSSMSGQNLPQYSSLNNAVSEVDNTNKQVIITNQNSRNSYQQQQQRQSVGLQTIISTSNVSDSQYYQQQQQQSRSIASASKDGGVSVQNQQQTIPFVPIQNQPQPQRRSIEMKSEIHRNNRESIIKQSMSQTHSHSNSHSASAHSRSPSRVSMTFGQTSKVLYTSNPQNLQNQPPPVPLSKSRGSSISSIPPQKRNTLPLLSSKNLIMGSTAPVGNNFTQHKSSIVHVDNSRSRIQSHTNSNNSGIVFNSNLKSPLHSNIINTEKSILSNAFNHNTDNSKILYNTNTNVNNRNSLIRSSQSNIVSPQHSSHVVSTVRPNAIMNRRSQSRDSNPGFNSRLNHSRSGSHSNVQSRNQIHTQVHTQNLAYTQSQPSFRSPSSKLSKQEIIRQTIVNDEYSNSGNSGRNSGNNQGSFSSFGQRQSVQGIAQTNSNINVHSNYHIAVNSGGNDSMNQSKAGSTSPIGKLYDQPQQQSQSHINPQLANTMPTPFTNRDSHLSPSNRMQNTYNQEPSGASSNIKKGSNLNPFNSVRQPHQQSRGSFTSSSRTNQLKSNISATTANHVVSNMSYAQQQYQMQPRDTNDQSIAESEDSGIQVFQKDAGNGIGCCK